MPQESAYFIVERTAGKRNLQEVKAKLDTIHGVTSAAVNPDRRLIAVDYDSSGTSYDEIEHCLNNLGYQSAADASVIQSR